MESPDQFFSYRSHRNEQIYYYVLSVVPGLWARHVRSAILAHAGWQLD
jgi:hypothetical protein